MPVYELDQENALEEFKKAVRNSQPTLALEYLAIVVDELKDAAGTTSSEVTKVDSTEDYPHADIAALQEDVKSLQGSVSYLKGRITKLDNAVKGNDESD